MKSRILRWLGIDADLCERVATLETLVEKQREIIVSLASEMNDLRNNLPAVLTQPFTGVRKARNWREFAAAAVGRHPENPQPIEVRTS